MENGGFKFSPTHQECIVYLGLKVTGCPFPSGVTIPDRNPYNLQEVAGIFLDAEKYGDLYFFTKLTSKGKTGTNNVNRTVGEGTWHGNTIKKVDHNGRNLGKYTKLSYQEKGNSIDHMRFSMTEYTLLKNTKIKYIPLTDYVLCHLEKNERWINGKRVSKYIQESMSNEIGGEANPVAAAHSTELLPSDQIRTHDIQPQAVQENAGIQNIETIYDPTATLASISDHDQIFTQNIQPISFQQPLTMEETAAGFQKYETLLQDGDSESLVAIDNNVNGPANDQRLYAPTPSYSYQYSSQVGYQSVPLEAPTTAAVLDNGLQHLPNYNTDEFNSLYHPEAPLGPFDQSHVAPTPAYQSELAPFPSPTYVEQLPLSREAPSHVFDETQVAPLPYYPPAAESNSMPESEPTNVEPASQDNEWLYDYPISMDFQSASAGQGATQQRKPVPNSMPESEPTNVEQLAVDVPLHQTTLSTLQFDPCCCWDCNTNFLLDF